MSTTIDQRAYLQKYLGGPSTDRKKKKKKVVKGKGFRIIDDDIDLTKLRPLDGDEIDILDEGEDGPQIAGIIDERPEDVKKLEQFKTNSKWRVVTQDDGFNSKLQIEEIKTGVKEAQKENELIFGKMYSDSEEEKANDSDMSPPRLKPNENSGTTNSQKRRQNNSDSDLSPPRRGSPPRLKQGDKEYDSDLSPPRKNNDTEKKVPKSRKPSRWRDKSPVQEESRHRSESPKHRRSKQKHSKKRQKSVSSDSDLSPPRKSLKNHKVPRNSPPNPSKDLGSRKTKSSPNKFDQYNKNKSLKNEKHTPRNRKGEETHYIRGSDSDFSPPRKSNRRSESPARKKKNAKRTRGSSPDLSPSRKDRFEDRRYKRSDDSPPPTNKKMEKTLDGKMAGLQDARQLREENEAFRKREDDAFSKMTDAVSGRNAQAVSRKGHKRETSEERTKQREKAERQKELDEKYKKWSKGIKQVEAQEARMQDFLHEAAKPLARHKGDRDLEASLKQIEREGDPMLQYIREKKRDRGELGPEKPTYKGNFPPNRFNIRPGYRWDGVDRSNGYEKKFFEHQSKRKAQEEEAYKWSTEDL